MNVGLFKTEGTVIKFSKKEKKKGEEEVFRAAIL